MTQTEQETGAQHNIRQYGVWTRTELENTLGSEAAKQHFPESKQQIQDSPTP